MDLTNVLILFIEIAVIVFGLNFLFTIISDGYIKKHKEKLLADNNPLAQNCKDLGLKLLSQIPTYYDYVNKLGINQTYSCSSSVVSNASNNNVKYLIKYSNIESNMYYLELLDFCTSYLQSLDRFYTDMSRLYTQVKPQIPIFIRMFATKKKVPYLICDINIELSKVRNPIFCFSYVSPAGKSGRSCRIEITKDVMKNLQQEISAKINKSGHAKTQRIAMTNDLREAIKKRDNYTCCLCGNSVFSEPNLLLEVDHIIPISKGGKTEASNLQTLCWRCNRAKGNN